jgi:hypothetical protein
MISSRPSGICFPIITEETGGGVTSTGLPSRLTIVSCKPRFDHGRLLVILILGSNKTEANSLRWTSLGKTEPGILSDLG